VALLRVEDLSIRFGGLAALADVSFEVADGEILGLMGPTAPASPPSSTSSPALPPDSAT